MSWQKGYTISCGVREFRGMSLVSHPSKFVEDAYREYTEADGLKNYKFAHVVLSDAVSYGDRLKDFGDYVAENSLGTTVSTEVVKNPAHPPFNLIKVLVWTPDWKNIAEKCKKDTAIQEVI